VSSSFSVPGNGRRRRRRRRILSVINQASCIK
jgi:hypothetical protein